MNERRPAFPAKTGEHDDDLTAVQRAKLEAGGSASTNSYPAPAGTTGVVSLRTWECPKHKIVVVQGDPCPECGKKQLLD